MIVTLGVAGDAELRRQLAALEASLQVQLLAAATRAGAELVYQRAKEVAPEDTGQLKRIGLQVKTYTRTRRKHGKKGSDIAAESYVTNTRAGAHAILLEYGVAPHKIGKRKHPGFEPKPFMRRAFINRRGAALSAVVETTRAAVLAAAASGGSGATE